MVDGARKFVSAQVKVVEGDGVTHSRSMGVMWYVSSMWDGM